MAFSGYIPSPDLVQGTSSGVLVLPESKARQARGGAEDGTAVTHIVKHPAELKSSRENCGFVRGLESVFQSGQGRTRLSEYATFSQVIAEPVDEVEAAVRKQQRMILWEERRLASLKKDEDRIKHQIELMKKQVEAAKSHKDAQKTQRDISHDETVKRRTELEEVNEEVTELTDQIVALSKEKETVETLMKIGEMEKLETALNDQLVAVADETLDLFSHV